MYVRLFRRSFLAAIGTSWLALMAGCGQMNEVVDPQESAETKEVSLVSTNDDPGSDVELATFGAGCFWCVEAVFQEVNGVVKVESGYAGGDVENPTYQQVCAGVTGHAEVCQITFDPGKTSYEQLLEVFWKTHDPTTLNRQGADVGTQYRSVIFYHNQRQRELAEQYKQELDQSGAWRDPIVTEFSPFEKFYKAEDYHQNYYRLNPRQGYCQMVIRPKMEKFRKVFKEQLKPAASGQ